MGKKQACPYTRQVRWNASSINSEKVGSFDDLMLVKNKIREFLLLSYILNFFFPSLFLGLLNLQLGTSMFFNKRDCFFLIPFLVVTF